MSSETEAPVPASKDEENISSPEGQVPAAEENKDDSGDQLSRAEAFLLVLSLGVSHPEPKRLGRRRS